MYVPSVVSKVSTILLGTTGIAGKVCKSPAPSMY